MATFHPGHHPPFVPTIVSVALVFSGICAVGKGDEAAARKLDAQSLILQILAEREKIVSGIVEFEGSRSLKRKGEKDFIGEFRGCVYFESEYRRLRFDNNVETSNLKLRQFRFIRQPEYSTYWEGIGPGTATSNVTLLPVEASIGGALAAIHHMYDFRASGVVSHLELAEGGLEQGITVKHYCEELLRLPVVDVTREGTQAEITFEDSIARRTLKIDTANGATPVEYVLTSLTDPSMQLATVQWERRDGIYVPREMMIQLVVPQSQVIASLTFQFNWKSINHPVDDEHFDYRNLPDVTPGIDIFDSRGDEPVLLGQWPGESSNPQTLWLVLGFVAILMCLAVTLLLTRLRQHSAARRVA